MAMDALWMAKRIQTCAELYRDSLLDRHVLFIPADGSAPFDCFFQADNFMHLCGVAYPGCTKARFFQLAVDHHLDIRALRPTHGRLTRAKLDRLPTLCRIDAKANAAVLDPRDHQGTRADLFCSNMDACIGFARVNGIYRPKTALAHNPARDEPGYVNLIAAVKTEPGQREFVIVCKEPKPRDKTAAKHSSIIRSLEAYPHRELVTPLLEHGF